MLFTNIHTKGHIDLMRFALSCQTRLKVLRHTLSNLTLYLTLIRTDLFQSAYTCTK